MARPVYGPHKYTLYARCAVYPPVYTYIYITIIILLLFYMIYITHWHARARRIYGPRVFSRRSARFNYARACRSPGGGCGCPCATNEILSSVFATTLPLLLSVYYTYTYDYIRRSWSIVQTHRTHHTHRTRYTHRTCIKEINIFDRDLPLRT